MKKIVATLMAASTLLVAQHEFDININNDTLEVGADFYLNDIYSLDNRSSYYLGATYYRSEDHDENPTQTAISTEFKMLNTMATLSGFRLGLGFKGVVTENQFGTRTDDFAAVGFGIYADYAIDEFIKFETQVNYAPKVLSFGEAENYKEFRVNASYKVVPNGYAYVGYRNITLEYENEKEVDFDDTAYVGFKFLF